MHGTTMRRVLPPLDPSDGRPIVPEARDGSEDAARKAAVERFGRSATGFRARSPSLRWWSAGARGGVAYAEVGGSWIAAGDPLGAAADLPILAAEFVAAADAAGRRAVFFATELESAWSGAYRSVQIGEQPDWDPSLWPAKVAAHRSLREQLRRARAKGVQVRESTLVAERAEAAAGRGPLAALLARWIAVRPMATMGFIVRPEPFLDPSARRLLIAERGGVPVGFVSLVPAGEEGWLVEHLVRPPDAPNGTAELLVHEAMLLAAAEGKRRVTLGLAPLSGNVAWWLRVARALSTPLFNFAGLAQFKRKMRPDAWRPIQLVHPKDDSTVRALLDALRAFAGGSLTRFVIETMRRSPEWSLHLLEWLLLPWTLFLAAIPTAPWFPSLAVHGAWVAFDLVLWALLRARRTGRRPAITRLVAVLTLGDALLSGAQAILWNLPRAPSLLDTALIVAGVAAPAVASAMLWRASARERLVLRARRRE